MRKFLGGLVLAFAAGCSSKDSKDAVADASPVIDPAVFSAWPSVTAKPIQIGPVLATMCEIPSEDARKRAAESLEKNHGPHAAHPREGRFIMVRVSPDALAAFREGREMPVGAVVVKEKYSSDEIRPENLREYAAMVKRGAGFYPAGGDWEYAYVERGPQSQITRGRLPECAGCHASVKKGDYLFRTYRDSFE